MKLTKVVFGLATLGLGIASAAASYDVTLTSSTWIGATELKAGAYKVEMQGSMAVFKSGKKTVEVPATLSNSDQKYSATSLSISSSKLTEIDFGGTKTKIVFSPDAQGATAAK